MTFKHNILITGGAGFIGSHAVRHFVKKYREYKIINLDKLTYAGNLENLKDIEHAENYFFVRGDIADSSLLENIFSEHQIDSVIHLAAESHVDRSIVSPMDFIKTNIIGTVTLLNAAKQNWQKAKGNLQKEKNSNLFYHISTDEVYGSLGSTGYFTEQTPYNPRSPYSASKASSDHLVMAYHHTYNLPVVISNCSNNYGPFHFPEKLIPLIINNIIQKQPLPVYGKGENVRDWLFVEDHVEAMDLIFHNGKRGEKYNVGGNNEWKNLNLVKWVCSIMDKKLNRAAGTSEKLITFVKDRAGHDLRYAIDSSKIQRELGWKPKHKFEEGIELTIDWYLNNSEWLAHVTSGAYQKYYEEQYVNR
ncbi:MAG TPA: dTDP-glucose 4,6-dehydratase [Bacteroidia bacterium]|nr:dTDP-glucose 4,6-dehydratase [Bacteroidia bacterium]